MTLFPKRTGFHTIESCQNSILLCGIFICMCAEAQRGINLKVNFQILIDMRAKARKEVYK